MKKVIRLTESELTTLIKKILNEDSSLDKEYSDCQKEYRNPESKTDPYKYRMGIECQWETKSVGTDYNGKIIKDWVSLYGNEKANKRLDEWFPNAKKECSNCKKKKTPIKNDCPKEVDCLSSSSPCKDLKIKACIKSGKTRVKTIDGGIGPCPPIVNCMPGTSLRPKLCDNPTLLKMCKSKGTVVTY